MEDAQGTSNNIYGLLGKNIEYSFSRKYFTKKFKILRLKQHAYQNFDLYRIEELSALLKQKPDIKGLNVTIPYKEAVIPLLDGLHKKAKKIGAVNTIKITKKGKLKGYNTDCYGFKKSLKPHLKPHHKSALILGTGGASKAIAYVFDTLNITYTYVSRTPKNDTTQISYDQLTQEHIHQHQIIVNCTPLGTHPNITQHPDIPFEYITNQHIVYDLIYNPSETAFLKKGKEKE